MLKRREKNIYIYQELGIIFSWSRVLQGQHNGWGCRYGSRVAIPDPCRREPTRWKDVHFKE